MRVLAILTMLFSVLALTACEQTTSTKYPISGIQCSAKDPVHDMTADCLPPT